MTDDTINEHAAKALIDKSREAAPRISPIAWERSAHKRMEDLSADRRSAQDECNRTYAAWQDACGHFNEIDRKLSAVWRELTAHLRA